VEVWHTCNLQRLRLGEEKRRKTEETQGKNILACPIPLGGHKKYAKCAFHHNTAEKPRHANCAHYVSRQELKGCSTVQKIVIEIVIEIGKPCSTTQKIQSRFQ